MKYSIEEVHAKIGKEKIDFDGDLIKMDSDRYKLFKQKGVKCVGCGIEGQYYKKTEYIEGKTPTGKFHFNLYAVKNGVEILMTKDHIIPKSKGGKNYIGNYQTMCTICNGEKADTLRLS